MHDSNNNNVAMLLYYQEFLQIKCNKNFMHIHKLNNVTNLHYVWLYVHAQSDRFRLEVVILQSVRHVISIGVAK